VVIVIDIFINSNQLYIDIYKSKIKDVNTLDWKKEAIEDLRKYTAQKESLKNIPARISAIEERLYKVKGTTLSAVPTHGGGSHYEDRMLDSIVEIERLKMTHAATRRLIAVVEKGLAGLTDTERVVLDRFYIRPVQGNVELLMQELGYEKTKIYSLKDQALYRYTFTMYGLCDY
jgi:ArpU family phage transcriptional regulator